MRLTIDSRIRASDLTEEELRRLTSLCEHDNPAAAERARIERSGEERPLNRVMRARLAQLESEPSKVATWRWGTEDRSSVSLPRGATDRILPKPALPLGLSRRLRLADVSLCDARREGDRALLASLSRRPLRLREGLEPRAYQERNVDSMLREEQGILRSACGSGKSTTFLLFAQRCGLPTLVATWSRGLFEQWVRNARNDLGLSEDEVGVLGGGEERIRPLTIAMVPTCVSRGWQRKYAGTFGALLCDEADGYAAESRAEFVDPFECRYRFAASDDERRRDEWEFLLYDLFGPVVDVTSRREAEEAGAIVPVRVRMVESSFAPPKWWTKTSADARGFRQAKLLKDMAANPMRARLCARTIAAYAREEGRRVLAFAHHVEHVRRLEADVRDLLGPGRGGSFVGLHLGGPENDRERRRTRDGLLDGSCRVAIATYASLGKGINLPAVDRAVLCTPVHNSRDTLNQTLGRLNRGAEGKAFAEASVIYDSQLSGLAPVRAYMAGGREVVVAPLDSREEVPAREWIRNRDAERRAGGASIDFFRQFG